MTRHRSLNVDVTVLAHGAGLPLPHYQSAGASGMDLYAAIENVIEIGPTNRLIIPTGIKVAIPAGYEGQVRTRSGMAAEHGLIVLNSPGTIDSDYRGEILVIMANLGNHSVVIKRGDRIAQLVFATVRRVTFVHKIRLNSTARGEQGFGSTNTGDQS